MDDDAPENTPGYKVTEKKAVSEYLNMDQEDESLRKYKEALLGKASAGINHPSLLKCERQRKAQ